MQSFGKQSLASGQTEQASHNCGQLIAQKVGDATLTYLHGDHLGSTVLTTGVSGSQKYHAYGALRAGGVQSDYQFTGHEADGGTGLIYMKARYYDPVIGQFISPDTVVPDPTNVYAYNRYMYAYGNPLKYNDPNGHEPHDDQLHPCDWGSCVKVNGEWVPIATWTPELHAQYYPEIGFGSPPFDIEMVQTVLDRAANFEFHYDSSGEIDWRKTFVTEFGDVLSICAADAGGVCGLSIGASGAVVGLGGRISLDFFVDKEGQMAGYISGGGGLYATFTGLDFKASGASVIWVPGEEIDVNDMAGWSVQLGGSAKAVAGLAVDWVVGADTTTGKPWHGVSVGQAGGAGVELHASGTYSHEPEVTRRFLAR